MGLQESFAVGQRVELHPGTDAWMAGDRFGEIERVGRTFLHVRMDRSGRLRPTVPASITRIVEDA